VEVGEAAKKISIERGGGKEEAIVKQGEGLCTGE